MSSFFSLHLGRRWVVYPHGGRCYPLGRTLTALSCGSPEASARTPPPTEPRCCGVPSLRRPPTIHDGGRRLRPFPGGARCSQPPPARPAPPAPFCFLEVVRLRPDVARDFDKHLLQRPAGGAAGRRERSVRKRDERLRGQQRDEAETEQGKSRPAGAGRCSSREQAHMLATPQSMMRRRSFLASTCRAKRRFTAAQKRRRELAGGRG